MGRKKVDISNDPWIYKGQTITVLDQCPKDSIGFVYLITNNLTGKMYVGKKSLSAHHTKIKYVLNEATGRKKKVREIITGESNWRTYYGSCAELIQDVKAAGKDNFNREILKFCYTKKELTFEEAAEQCKREVLTSDKYYNDNILGKFYKYEFIKKQPWQKQ